jgi:dolichol-phosphate mannosyltransferase
MGSRYFFICAYVWLEKYFSRGDYRKKDSASVTAAPMSIATAGVNIR